ncbi:anti-sigma regulatory factor [soil metagenome]
MTISLSIPGDAAHLAVMRATVASVAARAHLTLDQVEDVRLAVEEAASTLLRGEPRAIELSVDPSVQPLEIKVSAQTAHPVTLNPESFSWTILSAMTEDLDLRIEAGTTTLTMRFTSPVAG